MPVFVMFKRDLCCRSFYVGDAAGRPNDHSDADIKFAQVKTCFRLIFVLFLYSNFLWDIVCLVFSDPNFSSHLQVA